MEGRSSNGERVVVGRVVGVEPVRDLIESLRAHEFELLEVRDPDQYGAIGSNRALDAVAMRRYGRRLSRSALVGLALGAVVGGVVAGALVAADAGSFLPLVLMCVPGASFAGLALGGIWGLGSRLAVEDEHEARVSATVEDRTQIRALARDARDLEEITEIMKQYGEVEVLDETRTA